MENFNIHEELSYIQSNFGVDDEEDELLPGIETTTMNTFFNQEIVDEISPPIFLSPELFSEGSETDDDENSPSVLKRTRSETPSPPPSSKRTRSEVTADIKCYCGKSSTSVASIAGNAVYKCASDNCTFNVQLSSAAVSCITKLDEPLVPETNVLPDPMFPQEKPGYPDATLHGHINGKYLKMHQFDGKTTVVMEYPVTVSELELAFTLKTSYMASNDSILSKQTVRLPDKDDWFDYRSLRVRVIDEDNNVLDSVLKRFTGTLVSKLVIKPHWDDFDPERNKVDSVEFDRIRDIIIQALHREPEFEDWETCLQGQDSNNKRYQFSRHFNSNQFGVAKLIYQLLKDLVVEQHFDKETLDIMKLGSLMEDTITNDFLECLPHMTYLPNLNIASEDAGLFFYPELPFIASSPDQILTVTHLQNQPVFPFESPVSPTTKNRNIDVNVLKCSRYYVEYKTRSKTFNGIPTSDIADKDRKWIGNEFYRVKNYQKEGTHTVFPRQLTPDFPSYNWSVNGRSYNMPKDYYIQMLCNMNIIPGIDYGLMIQYANNMFRVIGVPNDPYYWKTVIVPRLCFVFKKIYLPYMAYNINTNFYSKERSPN